MKERIMVTVSIIAMFFMLWGCGGLQVVDGVDSKGKKIRYISQSYTLLVPPISPEDMANANLINSQANINNAIAENMRKGVNQKTYISKYRGLIVNSDSKKVFYLDHPELNQIVAIKPGAYFVIYTENIYEYVYGRWSGQTRPKRFNMVIEKKKYNGIERDYGARVWS